MNRSKNISMFLGLFSTLALTSAACVSQVPEEEANSSAPTASETTGTHEQALILDGQRELGDLGDGCLRDYCGFVDEDWFACDSWDDGGRKWFNDHCGAWSDCGWGDCKSYDSWISWYDEYSPYYFGDAFDGRDYDRGCLGDYCGDIDDDWFACDSWGDGGQRWFNDHYRSWSDCGWGDCGNYKGWVDFYGRYSSFFRDRAFSFDRGGWDDGGGWGGGKNKHKHGGKHGGRHGGKHGGKHGGRHGGKH